MKEIKIKSLENYTEFIAQNCTFSTVFRGHTNIDFELIPSVGRTWKRQPIEKVVKAETNMLRIFRTSSFTFLKSYNIIELELLAIAQYHGMKTRLLDWTRSALIALFFACEKDENVDACVYILNDKKINFIDGPAAHEIKPFSLTKDIFYIPHTSTNRIMAQSGLFLVFRNPLEGFTSEALIKVIIPKGIKKSIIHRLQILGITKAVLFPDLDGLSRYINYSFDLGY